MPHSKSVGELQTLVNLVLPDGGKRGSCPVTPQLSTGCYLGGLATSLGAGVSEKDVQEVDSEQEVAKDFVDNIGVGGSRGIDS